MQTKYSYWVFRDAIPEKDRNKVKRIAKKSGYGKATTRDDNNETKKPDKKVRNTDTAALAAKFYDSSSVVLNILESDADFIIAAPICYINEPTIDSGGPMLMQTIPFTIVGSDTVSEAGTEMLGITAVES